MNPYAISEPEFSRKPKWQSEPNIEGKPCKKSEPHTERKPLKKSEPKTLMKNHLTRANYSRRIRCTTELRMYLSQGTMNY